MSAQQSIWKDPAPFLPRVAVDDGGVPHDLPNIPPHLLVDMNMFGSDGLSSGSSQTNTSPDEEQFLGYEGDLVDYQFDMMLESCCNGNEVCAAAGDQKSENVAGILLYNSPEESSSCFTAPEECSSSVIENPGPKVWEEFMGPEKCHNAFKSYEHGSASEPPSVSPRISTMTSVHSPVNDHLGLRAVASRSRENFGKRKSKRAPARAWSEAEHGRFEEALELYGRDWGACALHIGTRPAPLVRSHAQKYLIKLWKLGKPLPVKVAESGNGYTLSGKPLLPESASARSYLTKIPCPRTHERKRK